MNFFKCSFLVLLIAISHGCSPNNHIISSSVPEEKIVKVLSEFYAIKSDIIFTAYDVYNANHGTFFSIPGPTNIAYKIYLEVAPIDAPKWIQGKEAWISSEEKKCHWLSALLTAERFEKVQNLTYKFYRQENNESKYYIWINQENGIVIIEYSQT